MKIEQLNDVNKSINNELLELRDKYKLLLNKNNEILKEKREIEMNLDKTTDNISQQRTRIESLQNIIDQKNAYIDDFNVISTNINSTEMNKRKRNISDSRSSVDCSSGFSYLTKSQVKIY